jgi:hypothetical protein
LNLVSSAGSALFCRNVKMQNVMCVRRLCKNVKMQNVLWHTDKHHFSFYIWDWISDV